MSYAIVVVEGQERKVDMAIFDQRLGVLCPFDVHHGNHQDTYIFAYGMAVWHLFLGWLHFDLDIPDNYETQPAAALHAVNLLNFAYTIHLTGFINSAKEFLRRCVAKGPFVVDDILSAFLAADSMSVKVAVVNHVVLRIKSEEIRNAGCRRRLKELSDLCPELSKVKRIAGLESLGQTGPF